jgi:hypothetical protein
MYQQPTIIDMLVGIAMEAIPVKHFRRFIIIGDATEANLNTIEKALTDIKYDWSSGFTRILEYEKLVFKSTFAKFYEVNPEGKTRLSQDPFAEIRAQVKKLAEDEEIKEIANDAQMKRILELSKPLTYRQRKVLKAYTILSWFFMPPTPQKAGEIIDAAYARYYAMAKPDFDLQKGAGKFSPKFRLNFRYTAEFTAGLSEESYHRVHDIYLRAIAQQRGSQILIALRRYKNKNGRWPVNLNDVKSMAPAEIFVDPINGGDFVYEITEENFRLYSKGKNGIDEDGEYSSDWPEPAKPDDIAIWPPRRTGGCETEEENTDDEQQ